MLYSSKGSEFEFGGTTATAKYNYLDIPILLRYSINEMISLHAGPQISLLMSAEDDDGNDLSDGVTGSDLGLSFGGQIDLPAGLVGGLRYNLGLSNIAEDDAGGEVKNKVFQVYVGYKLFGN
ncbi:outer membrane beta-barrel protein [Fulvivirga sp.]|uniref:outer membrane beta-barrel protein n=1 Tax=Fulvivirga sp. TaxID=1931237 RepID=UPI0032EAFB98